MACAYILLSPSAMEQALILGETSFRITPFDMSVAFPSERRTGGGALGCPSNARRRSSCGQAAPRSSGTRNTCERRQSGAGVRSCRAPPAWFHQARPPTPKARSSVIRDIQRRALMHRWGGGDVVIPTLASGDGRARLERLGMSGPGLLAGAGRADTSENERCPPDALQAGGPPSKPCPTLLEESTPVWGGHLRAMARRLHPLLGAGPVPGACARRRLCKGARIATRSAVFPSDTL